VCGMDSNGSGLVFGAGTFEYCNKFSCYVKSGEFLDQLRDHQLLKQDYLKHVSTTINGNR
jgi:hypothetical protein